MKLITSELKNRDALVKAGVKAIRDGYTLVEDLGYAIIYSRNEAREVVVLTRADV